MWIVAIIGLGAIVLFGVFMLVMNCVAPDDGAMGCMTDEETDAIPKNNDHYYLGNIDNLRKIIKQSTKNEFKNN